MGKKKCRIIKRRIKNAFWRIFLESQTIPNVALEARAFWN
jgi:hypothetical protein